MSQANKGFFKKHVEMFTIIGVIIAVAGLQEIRFSRIDDRFSSIERDISDIKIEIGQVKTVLIIRGMMPESMAVAE